MSFVTRFFAVAVLSSVCGLAACATDAEEETSPVAASAEETGTVEAAITPTDPGYHRYWTCGDRGNTLKYATSASCDKACAKACSVHVYCGTLSHPVECP